jgi:hypothetical protein
MTVGLDVLVQLVIAAITTEPSATGNGSPGSEPPLDFAGCPAR